jgi:hypothetical protein
MLVLRPTRPVQVELIALLNARASQRQIQRTPERRRSSAFLAPYVNRALEERMDPGCRGPWRIGWQRELWHWPAGPRRSPQVVRGRYRLPAPTLRAALDIRAMLNFYDVPEPVAFDRRAPKSGRRPRFDRRRVGLEWGD